jgi:lipopolysaccharide export system protein LptA
MKNKQTKTQFLLLFTGFVLLFITYFYYPSIQNNQALSSKLKNKTLENNKNNKNELLEDDTVKGSAFEEIEYKGIYDVDKSFIVKSKKAYISNEEPDVVYMDAMHVILYLNDGRKVNITSNKGRYNKLTYDCFFEEDVIADDGETKIYAKNLELLATKNQVKIFNNVTINGPTGFMYADKVDYDFETKHFKVTMFEDEKVKMKILK